jgi:hypothetical protein
LTGQLLVKIVTRLAFYISVPVFHYFLFLIASSMIALLSTHQVKVTAQDCVVLYGLLSSGNTCY